MTGPGHDLDLWRGRIDAQVDEHSRRLNAINGHVDRLRRTVWRWSGGLAVLLAVANILLAILLSRGGQP